MKSIIRTLIIGFLIILSIPAFTQKEKINPTLSKFPGIYYNPSGYLNGRLNTFIYPGASGTPFFMRSGKANASLVTKSGRHDSLMLKYDLLNDKLLLGFNTKTGIEEIQLNSDIIEGFNLFGAKFLHIREGILQPAGYYEEIYSGRIRLYKKHSKVLSHKSGALQYEYLDNNRLILLRDEQAYQIKNKSSLLKAFEDKRKEISTFLRNNQIIIKRATDAEWIRVIKYYESL